MFVFPVGLPDSIGTTANMPIGYKLLKNTTHYDEQINTCTFITQRVLNTKTMNKKRKRIKSQSKVLDKKQGQFIISFLHDCIFWD